MDRRVYDKYVVQIAAQGSLTKAAAQLGISQPALSSGLTALENELGYKLFDRKSVPITPTAEGRIYLEYVGRLQVLTDDLQRRIEAHQAAQNERIAIGGPVAYMESMVTDALLRFRKEHPGVHVTLKCSPLAELIEMASRGEISCFISTSDELPTTFEKHLLQEEMVFLCIPESDPVNALLDPENMDYTLLNGKDFIFLEEGQPLQTQAMAFLRAHGVEPRNRIVVNQVSTAVNLVHRGAGVCLATEAALMCRAELETVRLYPLYKEISGRKIYVAYDRQLFMPAACWEFVRCLMNHAE